MENLKKIMHYSDRQSEETSITTKKKQMNMEELKVNLVVFLIKD